MDIKDQMSTWGQGLQHTADTLIKRGTAMSGIIPTLFLVPVFISAAWVFKETEILPWLFSTAAIAIVVFYLLIFLKFALTDPDRLQSEEYRCEVRRINMITGPGLPNPVTAEELPLEAPTFNPVLERDESSNEEVSK